MKQADPSVIEFMSTYSTLESLKPREALFGGRTYAYKLYHKTSDGEKISYVDLNSSYPFCQARKSYPIGHPQIIFKDFEPIENDYGLIKATVYPHVNYYTRFSITEAEENSCFRFRPKPVTDL